MGQNFSGWDPRICLLTSFLNNFYVLWSLRDNGLHTHTHQKEWSNKEYHKTCTKDTNVHGRCCKGPVHIPGASPVSIKTASFNGVQLALGDFFQASGAVLLVHMVGRKCHGINHYPTPSPLPQFLPNDWAELVSKSSSLLTLWIDDSEACVLYCFPEICHEIKFQSSIIAGFIYHSFFCSILFLVLLSHFFTNISCLPFYFHLNPGIWVWFWGTQT